MKTIAATTTTKDDESMNAWATTTTATTAAISAACPSTHDLSPSATSYDIAAIPTISLAAPPTATTYPPSPTARTCYDGLDSGSS